MDAEVIIVSSPPKDDGDEDDDDDGGNFYFGILKPPPLFKRLCLFESDESITDCTAIGSKLCSLFTSSDAAIATTTEASSNKETGAERIVETFAAPTSLAPTSCRGCC